MARPSQQSRGTGTHARTDEVRDESDGPDHTGIVVTRTGPKPLCSVADRARHRPGPPEPPSGEQRYPKAKPRRSPGKPKTTLNPMRRTASHRRTRRETRGKGAPLPPEPGTALSPGPVFGNVPRDLLDVCGRAWDQPTDWTVPSAKVTVIAPKPAGESRGSLW